MSTVGDSRQGLSNNFLCWTPHTLFKQQKQFFAESKLVISE